MASNSPNTILIDHMRRLDFVTKLLSSENPAAPLLSNFYPRDYNLIFNGLNAEQDWLRKEILDIAQKKAEMSSVADAKIITGRK